MVRGVVSPAEEHSACLLRGELGMLKVLALPEVKEGSYWDQEANLVLCACHQR